MNLFLGQNALDGASDWVSRAKAAEGGEEALSECAAPDAL
ncbi:MAG: hypothetical protein NVS3B14_13270 [Ktedonobacteraceae bacterium]